MDDRSVSAGNIERSIVITGDGNQASISFGGDFTLPLRRLQIREQRRRRGKGYDPLPLLAPNAGVIPRVGRDDVLAELRAWLDVEDDISVHGLVGRAGTGKTRLAIELCDAVDSGRSPGETGWYAGFLRPSDLAVAVERLRTTAYAWRDNSLLVIDYAAAAKDVLAGWLDQLAASGFEGKVRLLLLDREAPQGFGWWHELTNPVTNRACTARELFLDADGPRRLPDLAAPEERRALLASAHEAAASLLGDAARELAIPAFGEDEHIDAELASSRFGNPLNLVMAGIITAEEGTRAALALRRLDAARRFARREIGRMVQLGESEGISAMAMRHALGFNGLSGGLDLKSLAANLSAELGAVSLSATMDALPQLLEQELPPPQRDGDQGAEPRLGTIQPDLVGEGTIVETLLIGSRTRVLAAPDAARRAYALTGARAAEALMRLIQDYGYAAEDPLAGPADRDVAQVTLRLLSAVADAIPDDEVERLETLVWAFPADTIVLREAAAAQTQRLVDIWRTVEASQDDEELTVHARARLSLSLHNLASRMSDLGQPEKALAAIQEAVDLRQELARAHPDAFMPYLAGSLNNLSIALRLLGRPEEALVAAEDAAALFRALAAARPDGFVPELAKSLGSLASCLSRLGRQEEALAAGGEATDLFRALAADDPDDFTPELARSLSDLSLRLSDLGRDRSALAAGQEAVNLFRALAAARPDGFTPDLAMSLNNLAARLSDVGRREEGLAMAQEAVDLRRALTTARPDAFKPALAGYLRNLAIHLSVLGRTEEALAAVRESVGLFRELAAARSDSFTPDLATTLSVLGDCYEQAGRMDEALRVDREALVLLLPLFMKVPLAFARRINSCLIDYLRRAEALGAVPEDALINPIADRLELVRSELEGKRQ